MRRLSIGIAAILLLASLSVAAQETKTKEAKPAAGGDAAKIARAMSAAPPAISRDAAIMTVGKDGTMRQLRAGTNGWMCMTEADGTPMCLDKEWQGWADAWINKKDPQIKSVGVAYMLRGDRGASNVDPYAKKATPDNQWVVSGPHIMVIVPDPAQLDALPTDPHNGGPWVMWKGTKYAHIMVPTTPMPRQPRASKAERTPAEKK